MSNLSSSNPKSADPDSTERAAFSMQHCLVTQQANNVLRSSNEIQRALRRLRQSLLNCEICPAFEECELREQFNLQVDMVIAEVNEEWGW
jgi:hypothetical protein